MQHALIVAHPDEDSFALTMARSYRSAAAALGHAVVVRDLYRMDFDPRLASSERPGRRDFQPLDDVVAERAMIADADVYAFIYPLWFNAPPAMLKGYLDRVFGMGFAYASGPSGNEPRLRGRRMISITSSGSPKCWLQETGMLEAGHKLFDDHVAAVCGLSVVDHLHFGAIEPNTRAQIVADCEAEVAGAVKQRFGPSLAR
jgi:NAD(P)H dehydrogenase (quinone)